MTELAVSAAVARRERRMPPPPRWLRPARARAPSPRGFGSLRPLVFVAFAEDEQAARQHCSYKSERPCPRSSSYLSHPERLTRRVQPRPPLVCRCRRLVAPSLLLVARGQPQSLGAAASGVTKTRGPRLRRARAAAWRGAAASAASCLGQAASSSPRLLVVRSSHFQPWCTRERRGLLGPAPLAPLVLL